MSFAAVHESGPGTQPNKAYAVVCPLPAEADIAVLEARSWFDPTET